MSGGFVWNDEVRRLIEVLTPLAETVPVRRLHWISTPDGTYLSDSGFAWCRDCATFKVRNLRKHERRREFRADYLVDGGWGSTEDGPKWCCGCSVRLECDLTDYGFDEELDHYRGNAPRAVSAVDAYEVRELLYAIECTSEDDAAAQEKVQEVIAIGVSLVASLASAGDV